MLRIILLLSLTFISTLSWSTTLADIKAHEPTSRKTWAEQWFYNINAPGVGYFKISFQTYIAPDSLDGKEKSYMHLAFTPLHGKTVKYDFFYNDLILQHPDGSDAFYYEVPGIIVADDEKIIINHPDFNFSMNYNGPHKYYWPGVNPGQTPFGIIPELPGVGGKWFLYTVKTSVLYRFNDGEYNLQGTGYTQVDKGWYDKESSAGMIYTMGLSDDVAFMFTGALLGNTNIEMWAGRYVSQDYDLVFYPAFKGLSVKREIDACAGTLHVELSKLDKKLIIDAQADPESFYIQNFPAVIIFGGEQNYMKSMQARIQLNVYHFGQLEETLDLPQALLEFSGPFTCNE
ncbi:hypothetical protein HQQ94_18855 [Shewanella sp. VB17]|uniref:hypothetical protein n=1 Tax=Shewanella sp. VB17 TaxID=2739432 RepID=UPI001567A0FD|nr:hypothetical protein [Shewanella sp. VB17]NRD75243.1 hypothetical protein [Shewanella sp. VB17]